MKQKLRALPKDLEETYQRSLSSSSHIDDLLRCLQWVTFSARPIKLEELAEVITINFQHDDSLPCYDPDLRYMDSRDVLIVCSGFLTEFEGIFGFAHFNSDIID